jgi:hypothetical protein
MEPFIQCMPKQGGVSSSKDASATSNNDSTENEEKKPNIAATKPDDNNVGKGATPKERKAKMEQSTKPQFLVYYSQLSDHPGDEENPSKIRQKKDHQRPRQGDGDEPGDEQQLHQVHLPHRGLPRRRPEGRRRQSSQNYGRDNTWPLNLCSVTNLTISTTSTLSVLVDSSSSTIDLSASTFVSFLVTRLSALAGSLEG